MSKIESMSRLEFCEERNQRAEDRLNILERQFMELHEKIGHLRRGFAGLIVDLQREVENLVEDRDFRNR